MDVSKLSNDNIEIIDNSKVIEIKGNNKLDSIVIDKDDREIKVSGLFIAIANVPETSYLLNGINTNKNGNVIVEDDLVEEIFSKFCMGK